MTEHPSMSLNRRRFLGGAAAAAAATAVVSGSPFSALGATASAATAGRSPRKKQGTGGYGPLAPVRDQTTGLELLALPAGFEYISYGWTNDPMDDGTPTPGSHDGMAAFWSQGRSLIVRNHERGNGTPFSSAAYDPTSAGGTTNLVFHPGNGRWESSYASLSGTIRNCAGGPTPWGSWLTCEETTQVNNAGTATEMRHGYVFDVPADGISDAVPLKGLGRFSHEAVAIDPATGIVYLTEDTTPSGLYRFVPTTPGDLTSGRLQMMAIAGVPTTYTAGTGTTWNVTDWVTIDDPDPAPGALSTVRQGLAKGGSAITRGEGVWYGNGRIYVISTSGGPAGQGQVFDYDPVADTLTVLFASPSGDVLNAPDNCCVSPSGGLVLCEDGSGEEFMHGLTLDGEIFQLAKNIANLTGGTAGKSVAAQDYSGSEWAGATFEAKHGKWLFANLQSPGVTFAITGPWAEGGL